MLSNQSWFYTILGSHIKDHNEILASLFSSFTNQLTNSQTYNGTKVYTFYQLNAERKVAKNQCTV